MRSSLAPIVHAWSPHRFGTPSAVWRRVAKRITETQTIPFSTRNVNDSSLAKGTKSKVTKQPVAQVVAVGTKTSTCDPNYTGCVPIASDVDCAGGSGDGPAYVQGPIRVIGTDIYALDRDGDGIACE
jgi:hypothetical protein